MDGSVDGADVVLRSEGQRLFLLVPGSLSAIASTIGCGSKQTVANWRTGIKVPGPMMREAIAKAYGIHADAWRQAPEGAPRPPPPRPRAESAPARSQQSARGSDAQTLDEVLRLIEFVNNQMIKADSAFERSKWASELNKALGLKHRLERANELLEDAVVRKHPMWKRIEVGLLKALERHNAARKDVIAVLRDILGEEF